MATQISSQMGSSVVGGANVGGTVGDINTDMSEGQDKSKNLGSVSNTAFSNVVPIQISADMGGTTGAVNISMESPQAIEALKSISGQAMTETSQTAMGTIGLAGGLFARTADLAAQVMESPTQSVSKFITPIIVVAAIVAAVYIYKRG